MTCLKVSFVLTTLIIASCLPNLHVALSVGKPISPRALSPATNETSNSTVSRPSTTQPIVPATPTAANGTQASAPPAVQPIVPAGVPPTSNVTAAVPDPSTASAIPAPNNSAPLAAPAGNTTSSSDPLVVYVPGSPAPKQSTGANKTSIPSQSFTGSTTGDSQNTTSSSSASLGQLQNSIQLITSLGLLAVGLVAL